MLINVVRRQEKFFAVFEDFGVCELRVFEISDDSFDHL